MKTLLIIALISILTACATPIGMAYSVTSTTSLVSTGKTIPEHTASKLTGADCSIWDAIADFAYVCEYNKNPALTYNRNSF